MSVKPKQFPVPLKHFFGTMLSGDFKLSIMVVLLLLFTLDNVVRRFAVQRNYLRGPPPGSVLIYR